MANILEEALVLKDISSRVLVLSECEVAASHVSLADLLPANAPAKIRDTAAEVSLGAAPLPGAVRVFTGGAISSRISQKDLPNLLEIPDRVIVRRASRLLTRGEVFETIHRVLLANHFALAGTVTPADLHVAAPVLIASGDVSLRVTRIQFDSGPGRLRVFIVPENGQGSLPFVATLALEEKPGRSSHDNLDPSASEAAETVETPAAGSAPTAQPFGERQRNPNLRGVPPLVASGCPAILRLVSPDMRMVLTVMPLENGGIGQEIRVRVPETGRIVRARVAGEGYLEASL